jgi:hypothetical protein
MLKKFMGNRLIIKFSLIYVVCSINIFPQPQNNLEIFYQLIDSSATSIIKYYSPANKNINLNFNLGESYSLFKNHLISDFYNNGFRIINGDSATIINYVLDEANVNYGNIFRDGFWGEYLVPRKIEISGNYLIKNNSLNYKNFNYNYTDTVKFDDVKSLENISYPFTQGDIPAEPFFSSLFEPLVAIGTAAIAVYLFFTIRSK